MDAALTRRIPLLAVATIALVLLWLARESLTALAVGGAFAYLAGGPVDLLSRRMPRSVATGVVFVLAGALLAAVLSLGIPALAAQVVVLADRLPAFADDAARRINALRSAVLPVGSPEFGSAIDAGLRELVAGTTTLLRGAVTSILLSAFRFTLFVFGLLLALTWAFYVLRDRERIGRALAQSGLLSAGDLRSLASLANAVLGRWLRAQLLLMLAVGVATTLGIALLGALVVPAVAPYVLLLGLFAGFTEIFPIVGPIVGAAPAVFIAFAQDPLSAVWVSLLYLAIQQLESLFLVPKVVGSAMSLHPAVLIVGLVVGGALFGIAGAALAAPLMALTRSMVSYAEARLGGAGPAEALRVAERPIS